MALPLAMRVAGPAFGLLGAALGFALSGVEAAVLWLVVAYFVGKSIESLLLTVRAGPTH